jgi:predicted nuclease of restriction endonuclease-like (RecB) superfamily
LGSCDEERFDQRLRTVSAEPQTACAHRSFQRRAVSELVLLYWDIGRGILERQEKDGWGSKVVDRLAKDLKAEFPEMRGFSPRNLKYMWAFAAAWSDREFVQQAAAQIPWFHNCLILDRLSTSGDRSWYIRKTIQNGWSRNILALQIESGLHKREGKAQTNFAATLPSPQSDVAQQTIKDPYIFDFLTLDGAAKEREVENGLMSHVQRFLLELGVGFALVGRQVHLEVDRKDYYLDLLFYHLKLRCFVVVDLKTGPFKPEYAGKMNFYLSAVDDRLRHPDDKPSIGLLLCKEKDRLTIEYALRGVSKPIGGAEWKTRLVESLPKRLQGRLPGPEEICKLLDVAD